MTLLQSQATWRDSVWRGRCHSLTFSSHSPVILFIPLTSSIQPMNTQLLRRSPPPPLAQHPCPSRAVAMVTPPTGAGYLPCYRSNWSLLNFNHVTQCLCPSLCCSLLDYLSLFSSWGSPPFASTFDPWEVSDHQLHGWLALLFTVCWLFTRCLNHLFDSGPCSYFYVTLVLLLLYYASKV